MKQKPKKQGPVGTDAARLKKLPVVDELWLGARRPFDIVVEDTPGGVDMCLWAESESGFVRMGTVAPQHEEPDLLTLLLEKAMLTPMEGARPARPKTVAVENPPDSLRALCRELGIALVEKADFSAIDEVLDGAEEAVGGAMDYLVDQTPPRDVGNFIEAANKFRRAAPWRHVPVKKPLRLEGLEAPLNIVILGESGIEQGAVICFDDQTLSHVLKGREISVDGPPLPLLFFSWAEPQQVGGIVYAQAKQHGWKLKEGEDAPLLMSFQRPDDGTLPTADELRLATAVLEILGKLSFSSEEAIDTRVTHGKREVHVRWPFTPPKPAAKGALNAPFLQIRVSLRDTKVWRSIVISDDATVHDLHDAIQNAMGWSDSHLWCIQHNDEEYEDEDSEDVLLSDLELAVGSKLTYTYDYGDDWVHDLKVEKRLAKATAPACIGGEGACPPEDCGGPFRYSQMLDALKNARHRGHEIAVKVLGKPRDLLKFDVKAADERMRRR